MVLSFRVQRGTCLLEKGNPKYNLPLHAGREVACAGVSTWIFDLSEVGQRVTGAFLQIFDLSEVFFMEKFEMTHANHELNWQYYL